MRNWKAVLRVVDGRLEQPLPIQGAVGIVQHQPPGHVTGDQCREDPGLLRLLCEPGRLGGLWRPAGEVERPDAALGTHIYERQPDSTDTRHVWLDYVKCGRRGHGGVEGVAAVPQHPDACHGRQGVCRGDHPFDAHGDGPGRLRRYRPDGHESLDPSVGHRPQVILAYTCMQRRVQARGKGRGCQPRSLVTRPCLGCG